LPPPRTASSHASGQRSVVRGQESGVRNQESGIRRPLVVVLTLTMTAFRVYTIFMRPFQIRRRATPAPARAGAADRRIFVLLTFFIFIVVQNGRARMFSMRLTDLATPGGAGPEECPARPAPYAAGRWPAANCSWIFSRSSTGARSRLADYAGRTPRQVVRRNGSPERRRSRPGADAPARARPPRRHQGVRSGRCAARRAAPEPWPVKSESACVSDRQPILPLLVGALVRWRSTWWHSGGAGDRRGPGVL